MLRWMRLMQVVINECCQGTETNTIKVYQRKETSDQKLTVIPSFAMPGITIAGASALRNQAVSSEKGM